VVAVAAEGLGPPALSPSVPLRRSRRHSTAICRPLCPTRPARCRLRPTARPARTGRRASRQQPSAKRLRRSGALLAFTRQPSPSTWRRVGRDEQVRRERREATYERYTEAPVWIVVVTRIPHRCRAASMQSGGWPLRFPDPDNHFLPSLSQFRIIRRMFSSGLLLSCDWHGCIVGTTVQPSGLDNITLFRCSMASLA